MRGADPLPRHAGACILRRLEAADLAAFQAYRQDPIVARYQGWTTQSDAGALEFLDGMKAARLLQPGIWSQIGIAGCDRASLLGDIGLLLAGDGTQVEIGFTLGRESQGRGIATAAVREAIDLVFEQTGAGRVVAITDARNTPSIRLLQRVGMHVAGSRDTVFREEPCVEHVYAILRPDAPR